MDREILFAPRWVVAKYGWGKEPFVVILKPSPVFFFSNDIERNKNARTIPPQTIIFIKTMNWFDQTLTFSLRFSDMTFYTINYIHVHATCSCTINL